MRIARGGANWIITPIVVAILMAGLAGPLEAPMLVPLSTIPFFVALLLLGFFRDPERTTAAGVACPADGMVRLIDTVEDPDLGPCDRLSIFMRPQDVHVNRAPFTGDVRSVTHTPGGHVPAFSKESDRNERVTTILRTPEGDVKIVQIAGTVARRIVPYIAPGDHIEKGERIGLIRLSSRCDLIVPVGRITWTVKAGQRVWGGRTEVAA